MHAATLKLSPQPHPPAGAPAQLRDLHGDTHDAYGALWLLDMHANGTTSIWRAGHRIARLPWRPVAAALGRARSPGGVAAELIALFARQLGGSMPYAIADALASQIANWAEGCWPELERLAND